MYSEDEYLAISGIQHFMFCQRQWALIHIEQQWSENYLTADGRIMHERVHNPNFREKRGELITVRAMAVSSARLGINGECDAVEFRKAPSGVEIHGLDGKYDVTPVEYKRGEPKESECDVFQLVAQALCLEDMLCCEIPCGYLFYGKIRRRVRVDFDQALRQRTEEAIAQMHKLYAQKHTPRVKRHKACNACSLKDLCLPVICGQSALEYFENTLDE